MKKFLALILALVLAFSLSSVAFAADTVTSVPTEKSNPVKVTTTVAGAPTNTYCVLIKWGTLTFTYNATGTKTWNPNTHAYDLEEEGSWDGTPETEIKIENHSDVAVVYEVTYAKTELAAELSANSTGQLESAVTYVDNTNSSIDDTYKAGDIETVTVTITDKPAVSGEITAGTITVAIKPAP